MNISKLVTILCTLVLISTSFVTEAAEVIENGTIPSTSSVEKSDFEKDLTNYSRFVDYYTSEMGGDDLSPCDGQKDIATIRGSYIDLCSVATKLGYSIEVYSRFVAKKLAANASCQSQVQYELTLLKGTKPQLLINNISKLVTVYCLGKNGKVTFQTSVVEGENKTFLYRLILGEVKKMIPTLNRTVKKLLTL